jgi:hypothetical protein
MKEQHEAITLNGLNRNGTPTNRIERILQETVGKSTTNGSWTWHSGFLSLPGVFWGFTSL